MDQRTGRTGDDLTPPTKVELDPVDPAVKTAVAADMEGRPSVLICCPMAIEYTCVVDEFVRIANERRLEGVRSTLATTHPNSCFQIDRWNYTIIQSGLAMETWKNATRFNLFSLRQVWLLGFAGALDESLLVGDTIEPDRVVDQQTAEGIALSPFGIAATVELLTAYPFIVSPSAKAPLRTKFGCRAVDMEAYHLASTCQCSGAPFHTARAISDGIHDVVPNELDGVILASGDVSLRRLLVAVLKRPTLIGPLYRLYANSRKAKAGLRELVRRLVKALAE